MPHQIETPTRVGALAGVKVPVSFSTTKDNISPASLRGKHPFSRGKRKGQPKHFGDLDTTLDITFGEVQPPKRGCNEKEFKIFNKFASRMKQTRELIMKLETHTHEHPAIYSAVKALRNCKAYVAVKNGEPYSHYSLCRSRLCPVCGHQHRQERRQEVLGLIDYRRKGWKTQTKKNTRARLAMATMTIRSRSGWTCKNQIDELKRVWSRFNKRSDWRAFYKDGLGGIKAVEVEHNKKNDTYHAHLHFLLEIPQNHTMTGVKDVMFSGWKKEGGGHILKMKKVDDVVGSVMETTKYITAGLGKKGPVMASIVAGTHNSRLFSVIGSWKKDRKAANEAREEMKEVHNLPEKKETLAFEPSPVNPRTGEVATPEDGQYSLDALMVRAKKNDWNAIYLLRVFKYQQTAAQVRREQERMWDLALARAVSEPDEPDGLGLKSRVRTIGDNILNGCIPRDTCVC